MHLHLPKIKVMNWKIMMAFVAVILFQESVIGQEVHEKRFYPTRLYQKGGHEVKLFNNYYMEGFESGFRQDFFASFLQILIGTDKNLNFGLDLKFRSAATSSDKSNRFIAFPFSNQTREFANSKIDYRRVGLSAIGPRVKYGVKSTSGSLSFLHAVYFPTLDQAEGNDDYGFADWEHIQIFNSMYFEKKINGNSSYFIDTGIHFENLGSFLFDEQNGYAQLLTPFTFIYNYFPSWKQTIYGLVNVTPRFGLNDSGSNVDLVAGAFAQLGLGGKYFIRSWLEAELLYTQFFNFGSNSSASTINLGFRYSRN